MKPHLKLAALFAIILIGSCKKDAFVPRSTAITKSVQDFYNRNKPKPEIHFVDATNGGSFTTAQGTTVTIPANAFVDQNNNPVTGIIKIEFLDVYKKSDMIWTGMMTQVSTGEPLKSAGEFMINAFTLNDDQIDLIPGNSIDVDMPLQPGEQIDPGMTPFVANSSGLWEEPDTVGFSQIIATASSYVYSIPNVNHWFNGDNQSYYASYPNSPLTINVDGSFSSYNIYLLFNDENTVAIPTYQNQQSYQYAHAPHGFSCTVIAISCKDGKLYSSFIPVTISNNLTINLNMTEITEADFKTTMEALN